MAGQLYLRFCADVTSCTLDIDTLEWTVTLTKGLAFQPAPSFLDRRSSYILH